MVIDLKRKGQLLRPQRQLAAMKMLAVDNKHDVNEKKHERTEKKKLTNEDLIDELSGCFLFDDVQTE